ncbi:hypothetical protein NP493_1307g01016 [Ridgeia piscesae]|uniref:Solute carrier organic anion transporter family member n=1 Tax=Ridgeia piscesae TaxID=27915 RepID=A0AAD9NFU8_RIDPI|nr:hypothetical protein NP493_1307g01016 [Ridgeia piscesae]
MAGVDHGSYGVGGVRPRWMQGLNKPAFFLVFTATAVFIQSMCVNGLIGVSISTLERRFGWRSTEAGLVPVFADLCGLPVLLVVGYYGSRAHKPRWTAVGMTFVGLGSLLFALPHFTTGPYDATGKGSMTSLCEISRDNSTSLRCSSAVTESGLWNYLYLFVVAISLMGMGSVPLTLLSVVYYDDCLPRHKAALYTGIFYAFSTIGPAVAYIGGGYILNVHTDVNLGGDHADVSVDDPRWVGAWWILYIVTGLMAIAIVLPILSFPAEMTGAEEVRKTRITEVHSSAIIGEVGLEDAHIGWPHIRDIPRELKLLFLNPTFLCMTLAGVGDAVMVAGFGAFGPKYLQNQFSISAAMAGMIFGILAVPGAAGGSFLGSYVIKRLRMTCSQLLRYHMAISFVVIAVTTMFLIQCRQQTFVGVNVLRGNRSMTSSSAAMTESCNTICGCDNLSYDPVCGVDRHTYFSPCHAGCLTAADKTYTNCSCVEGSGGNETTAMAGMCAASDCKLMALFCFLLFLAMFFIFVAGMFHLCIVLR